MTSHDNTFTIQNFDKSIGKSMLTKGEQYYDNGAVLDIEENNGDWTAEVEGTEIYSVNVSLEKDNEITRYYCDCPYDGDICKHLVAVFYTIREEIASRPIVPLKNNTKNQFEDLLNKITAKEYAAFIKEHAKKNKDFKIAFEIFFAEKDERIDVNEKYTKLIRKLIDKFSSSGYLDYRSSAGLTNEIFKLIGKGNDLVSNKNYLEAFAIATSVLKEMSAVLSWDVDSGDSLYETLTSAIELIADIAGNENTPFDMKERIFDFLLDALNKNHYSVNDDYGPDLFPAFKDLAIDLNKDREFLSFIDVRLNDIDDNYNDYDDDFLITQKIWFLEALGRHAEAENLIRDNLDIDEIRESEVNKAIGRKDFDAAKKLIADSIEIIKESDFKYRINGWEKRLLQIAVLENDVNLVRQYSKKFAFEGRGFDKEYYRRWKGSYENREWQTVINELITQITREVTKTHDYSRMQPLNRSLRNALGPIFIEEQWWDRLFELLEDEQDMDRLMHYHEYLAPRYPNELLKIYLPGLEQKGDNASSRNHYANLVGLMKLLIKDIPSGKEQILATAQKLKARYPRRSAMVEELNRLLK